MSLSELVNNEARKMGVSNANATRALKMLKKGKVDMSKIAPQIKDMFMNNNPLGQPTSLKARLRAKMNSKMELRKSNVAKKHNYDKSKEQLKIKDEKKKEEKENRVRMERNKRRRHNKKLKELEKRVGEVDIVIYNKCLEKLQNNDNLSDQDKKYCENIIELYQKQQQFTKEIEKNDLDDIDLDLSDLSDFEED